jgi:hypothetical protein
MTILKIDYCGNKKEISIFNAINSKLDYQDRDCISIMLVNLIVMLVNKDIMTEQDVLELIGGYGFEIVEVE